VNDALGDRYVSPLAIDASLLPKTLNDAMRVNFGRGGDLQLRASKTIVN
jgi:hypothetical protein